MKGRKTSIVAALTLTLGLGACAPSGAGNGGEDSHVSQPPANMEIISFDNTSAPLAERIGVTNWGAMYMPELGETESSLLRGAETILDMGGKVIKIACGNPAAQYPLDDFSDLHIEECVDVLKFPTFKTLFEMDFKTYFISITEAARVKYSDGVSEDEAAAVETEFYNATKYLLETYRGSGKIFILQNWETDNYVGYSISGNNAEYVFRNYANYFNARQNGINRAREELTMSEENNVFVFGALEINKLDDSYTTPKAVDYVVPYTYADLYTYSSYEYKDKGVVSSAVEIETRLKNALAYYRAKLPPERVYPQKMYFGENRLAITEFGYPDKADGYSGEWQQMVVQGHLLAMQSLSLQYAVYWQLCCNELIGDNANEIKALSREELRACTLKTEDVNGFYLLKPDGTKTLTYGYLKDVFETDKIIKK